MLPYQLISEKHQAISAPARATMLQSMPVDEAEACIFKKEAAASMRDVAEVVSSVQCERNLVFIGASDCD
ncbi:MAG: hypothetical protein Aurels2KO_21710 [Aureliella sp.]